MVCGLGGRVTTSVTRECSWLSVVSVNVDCRCRPWHKQSVFLFYQFLDLYGLSVSNKGKKNIIYISAAILYYLDLDSNISIALLR